MDKKIEADVTSVSKGSAFVQPLHGGRKLYIGIDVGSTSSDIVVLDEACNVLLEDYRRTKGKPLEAVREQIGRIFKTINPDDVVLTAATGSAARFLAKMMNIPFVNEVPAQAAAISRLYPQFEQATIIEMGGQDSKLIFISKQDGQSRVRDFALNTVCAAGTGSFLDQQADRLGIDIENEFGQLALQSKTVPRMAGRCSVFAKSDMIHLQQQATPVCDIVAGLCLALARNLKSNLGCGRQFAKPIVFTGGVAANMGVVKAIERIFDLSDGELVVPEKYFFTGAIGAVIVAKTRADYKSNGRLDLGIIDDYLSRRGAALADAPRRPRLAQPSLPPPKSLVFEHLLDKADGPVNAYLGVDVGSISTNVAVIDEKNRLLAKAYLMTAGRPLEAIRQGLEIVGKKVTGKVKILGAASTGSGRYLTGDFIGADIVINEITAQAAGASIVNPNVDTIFEIGGQDSKYISLENGVVVDFEMNHACAAGTGSFLEEQAQRLEINIENEFAERAFASKQPIKLGERCTVFMESDLLSYLQQGALTEDLVAGLSYSIVTNYLNRVVGRRKIGSNICFQGGTAFNKAVWAAFEKVTGRTIMVPDHHEVTGAIGAAAIAADFMNAQDDKTQSRFRGFENLIHIEYSVESFTCEHCPNTCEIKKVQLPGSEPLYYGSRCDRYNLKKKQRTENLADAFAFRESKLFEFAGLGDKPFERKFVSDGRKKIGIPMALVNYQLLPMFSQFFNALGFEVVLSARTSKRIIKKGVEAVTAQTCFPVKVAFGHIAELIDKGVDYIFLPSIVSATVSFDENKNSQLCPYVQTIGYQAAAAFNDKLGKTQLLTVPIRLGDGPKLMKKTFYQLGAKLDIPGSRIARALEQAVSAQNAFENALKEKGSEILANLKPTDRLFVLVSRPYNGCDDGLNLELPKKLSELGVTIIPMDMLDLNKARLSNEHLHKSMYWSYGQKILRAAEIIRSNPNLFAIYLSNFSCGPDSFLMTFFKDIMEKKPCLQLEIDEHSADAGLITRLEAFLESLKHYKPYQAKLSGPEQPRTGDLAGLKRTWYIPYMGDCSYGVAAAFRAYGQPAVVMPVADEATLLEGRAYTTGKECLPCAITTGDMLMVIRSKNFDSKKAAFFMPSASGPCRFGMYNCMLKFVLKCVGCDDVPVLSPNQDSSFYKQLIKDIKPPSGIKFVTDLWISVIGIDLLLKLILRIRPFAKDTQKASRIYQKSLQRWVAAVENHKTFSQLRRLMADIADEFATLELDRSIAKPRVGIIGEIYVRSHCFANGNLVDRLEQLGAVCELASLAEWVYYTNFVRARKAGRRGQFGNLLTNVIQNYLQRKIEKSIARPLEKRFGPLAEQPVEKVLEMASPYIHNTFEGEAILSVGKTVEMAHQGVGGVVNVMPFTCMPSTIVSMQTGRISADCGGLPILNLSFDGQEDPTLTTRLEAFVEQVRQRQLCSVSIDTLISA